MRKKPQNFKKILFPTDFTGASEKALSYAVSLAGIYTAKLFILHAVNTKGEASGFYVPHLSFERLDKEMKEGAKETLMRFSARLLKGVKGCESVLAEGEPYREIIKFAKDNSIDIIVMGTFGKARMDRFLFGSTTEKVLRLAPCPVLVVPPVR